MSFSCLALGQTNTPPKYQLGEIPGQTVWAGSSRIFLIQASGTLNFSATPQPAGPLTLEHQSGPEWLFRYVPAPADIAPFDVTVTSGNDSQTFTLTPQPNLPPETSFFANDEHTQPVIPTHEVSVFVQESPLPENFNYTIGPVLNVRFVGEVVELEANHENGLYEAYTDRRDIKSLEIIAEKVIVRDPVRLKQTALTIHARELIFEEQGRIQTTPEEVLTSAGANASGGLPGQDGLPAGNIVLRIGNLIDQTTNNVVFDLTGGRGQPGGPGQHGSPGSDVTTQWSSFRYCDSGICKTHTPPNGYVITYWKYTFAGITVDQGGTTTRPGDGTHARPSGKPGEGGGGGSLLSSISAANRFANSGGMSATPSLPSSAPFDRFQGGRAGTPINSEQVHFYLNFFTMESSGTRHTSKKGNDAELRRALATAGANGAYGVVDDPFSWVHPLWLRKVLSHAKDEYLANDLYAARARLVECEQILTGFRAIPAWQTLDTAKRLELSQIHDEIRILLQQIEGGFDYFGNPAGWVPMLSFEVTKNIFESEIDRAIETLYLTYWLGNKAQDEQQKFDALSAARDQLRADLERARTEYDVAVERLPILETTALNLQSKIQTTQNKLEAEERKLLEETGEPDWVLGLRLGLKISAMICQMVPVYQPALGAVGAGLRVASDFDPNNPWSTITNSPSIASAYTSSPFKDSANATKTTKNQIDPGKAETNSFNYVAALQQSTAGLAAGVTDIQKFIEKQKAPTPEMLAELERLKSQSPEYKALIEEVEALMEENLKFTEDMLVTMHRVATLADVMSHNLLAIDALNREIAPGATVLDERATAYLQNMERRAFDRLLKYHYYMAKAYEYRLLRPYTDKLNLEGLFQKFEEIASLNSHVITGDQFNSLRQVYHDRVANLAESIYDNYISNPPDLSVPVRFNLTEDELATLNSGGDVALNLHHLGLFPISQENVRIVDLRLFSITTEPEGGGNYGSTAFVDFRVEHSGLSNLKQDGRIYNFRHYNRQTQNPIVWGGRYDPVDNQIDPIRPSDATDSLLRSLLNGSATADMLLYSRPSAWADLLVSRSFFDSSGRRILIKSVRFEMVYDFTPRNETLGLHTLEVLAASVEQGSQGQAKIGDQSILPFITVAKADANARQHARGQFTRVYPSGTGAVQLSAPPKYGIWQFHKWADRFGADPPGGPVTNLSIALNLESDAAVMAQYILPATRLILESPVIGSGNITLQWNGRAGVRLQKAAAVTGPWLDVVGTGGQSQFSVIPTAAPSGYFRLTGQ